MKRYLSAVIFAGLTIVAGRADWVIESRVDAQQTKLNITAKLTDEFIRLDTESPTGGKTSTIVNATTGDSIQLIHAGKTVVRIPGTVVKQQIQALKQTTAGADAAPQKAKPTGEQEKIGPWDCEIYTWAAGNASAKLWVASNVPNGEQLKAALAKLRGGALAGSHVGPDESELPGPVVRSETAAGGQTSKMTMISVKEQKIDRKVFEVPADYKSAGPPPSGAPASPRK